MVRTKTPDTLKVTAGITGGPVPTVKEKGARRMSPDASAAPGTDWEAEARHILKAEMERRGVTLKELARRLELAGSSDTPKAIGMRINRGTFSFAFALRAFRALGVTKPDLSPLLDRMTDS
jgi:hypothetical protein